MGSGAELVTPNRRRVSGNTLAFAPPIGGIVHAGWMSLSDALGSLSHMASDFLTNARSAGWDAREETVTEQLLVGLFLYPGADTRVYKVSSDDEAEYGPDFLWAVHRSGLCLSLWVQAKKASGQQNLQYKELGGARAKDQAVRLLINAYAQHAIPAYAFYNPAEPPFAVGGNVTMGACAKGQVHLCPNHRPWHHAHGGLGCSRTGVTIADGVLVATNAVFGMPAFRQATAVNDYAMPWECLVCPHRPGLGLDDNGGDGPDPAEGGATGDTDLNHPVVPLLDRALRFISTPPDTRGGVVWPRGVSEALPHWAVQLQETGRAFEESLRVVDPPELPTYFVVTQVQDE